MPRILYLVPMPAGRMGVVLDVPPSDDGSVSLFTATELDAQLALARSLEREDCAEIVEAHAHEAYPDLDKIAAEIRDRAKRQ